jgi:uncharacterized protein (DUF58 family)
METTELLKKVRKIEIKTRGLSSQIFSGEYHSAFKGRGMAFSEVREYYPGDDIRTIDWNVTARFSHPFVKVYEEERELTVMLVVDVSASENFGTRKQLKRGLITELCAVLAFSAIQNNDKIGLIFFSDRIEKYIPPKKGKFHILRIIRELIEFTPLHKTTHLGEALRYLTNVMKKRTIAFVISDFMSPDFSDALKIANKKHDVVALQIYDHRESELPDMGLVKAADAETGNTVWVDTSSPSLRAAYHRKWSEKEKKLDSLFTKAGVDCVKLRPEESYTRPLMQFFKRRGAR